MHAATGNDGQNFWLMQAVTMTSSFRSLLKFACAPRFASASIGISTTANPMRARPPHNSILSTIFTHLAVPADSTYHPLTNDQSQFLPEEAEHLSDAISLAPTKKIRLGFFNDWRVSRRTSVRSLLGSLGSLQKIRRSFADFLQQGCQQTKRMCFSTQNL